MHESAGGFLFFQKSYSQRLFVALLKTLKGEYVIPKGHLKKRESPEDAALREVKEELLLKKNPQVVSKLGTKSYTFTRAGDKLPNRKKVHLYVFRSFNKEEISPLKSEGFVAAKWFLFQDALKKITFDRENPIKAKKLLYLDRPSTNHPWSEGMVANVIRESRKTLTSNLFAVILAGSIARGAYQDGWSDIDVLLVVKKMDLETKNKIAEMVGKLEKKAKVHHGVNIVTTQEITKPSIPTISLDGKTLQALVELQRHPDRLVYIKKGHSGKFYTPSKKGIREYSLANIGMFARKNRRDLTVGHFIRQQKPKEVLKTEIRASLTMVKLAVQYFGEYSEQMDILGQARKVFPWYDFKFLELAQETIQNWRLLNNEKDIATAVIQADRFIEDFSQYVYREVEKLDYH